MRKGQNPAKFVKTVAKPERITVTVLNFIPFLSGFYAEMLEVLKANLNSIRENPGLPFDLLVFDNGSCAEVVEYLVNEQQEGNIQYLLLSEKNLGKGGAWNIMLSGAPGEIIAYADNDVLFYPNWLAKSVELLETFPNVGMVTSRPFRTDPASYSGTLRWGENDPEARIEQGNFIDWKTFLEFDLSLGQSEESIKARYDSTQDVRLTYGGMSALAGASHWQFVARKSVLAQFLPFDMDRPMGQVKQLDQRMNEAGLLRLMTVEPFAMNMSNSRPVAAESSAKKANAGFFRGVLNMPFVRKTLMGIYNRIFLWYYDR